MIAGLGIFPGRRVLSGSKRRHVVCRRAFMGKFMVRPGEKGSWGNGAVFPVDAVFLLWADEGMA